MLEVYIRHIEAELTCESNAIFAVVKKVNNRLVVMKLLEALLKYTVS